MLTLPVSSLTGDYKKLIEHLTVNNPEYTSSRFFGGGHVSKKIPRKLEFYRINEADRTISVPRNIDQKFFKSSQPNYMQSVGREIPNGTADSFSLRPTQKEYFEQLVLPYLYSILDNNPEKNIDLLLNAECGSGKTVMALALANEYGRNTLICVTIRKIGEQFIDTVKTLFPNWTIGWEDGKTDFDITLATYALLSQPKYDSTFFDLFGHIVMDEFHRCGAETYATILEKAGCKYRTSLTATFRRKDGLQKILKFHAGEVIEMERTAQKAIIYPLLTGAEINEDEFRNVSRFPVPFSGAEEYTDVQVRCKEEKKELDRGMIVHVDKARGTVVIKSSLTKEDVAYKSTEANLFKLGIVSAPLLDTEIAMNDARLDEVLTIIRECRKQGRKIVVLGKRKEQLYKLASILTRYGMENGVFVSEADKSYKAYCEAQGRTVQSNRDYVFNQTNIIIGIDKLAEEGMDVPSFDTLIYLHPIRDIEQSIGRILREFKGKLHPIAFYLVDKVNSYNKAFYGAKGMFERLGHKVHEAIDIEQFKVKIKNGEI